ncbi:hypothetical protein [Kribbella sp. NPDC006257]|uniref:hypothetical protein n=1 Tax=Kribbella sp. NPDC006257 TaxID=3156738 RepID=UPI0033A96206
MSNRIVVFCSDLINASGPLTPDELSPQVRAAGLTKAINPVTAIRSALRQSPVMVQLPDGRFDSARRMLDGVALTHRVRFATKGRQVLYAGPELSILDQILVHEGSLALTTGGAITSSFGEFSGWCGPPDWLPDVPAESLLAFRFRNGRLAVEPVPHELPLTSPEVERLRLVLRRYLMTSDALDTWRSHHTLGKVMLRALAEVPDLLVDPLPPLDEILRLGDERWGRDWPVESADGPHDGHRVVLHDVPAALVSALHRDADRLGVTTGELTVLLLSAATYRTAMPCRHDAQSAWLNPPTPPTDYYPYEPHEDPAPPHTNTPEDPNDPRDQAPANPRSRTAAGGPAPAPSHTPDDPDDPAPTHSNTPEDPDDPAPTHAGTPDGPRDPTLSGYAGKLEGDDDCEVSDDFEEVWIDDLPEAVLALRRPPE